MLLRILACSITFIIICNCTYVLLLCKLMGALQGVDVQLLISKNILNPSFAKLVACFDSLAVNCLVQPGLLSAGDGACM